MKKLPFQEIKISIFICKNQWYFVFLSMGYIQGVSRFQLSFGSLEDLISMDNPVRFIDVFSYKLDLVKIGFSTIKRQWGYNHTNLTGLEKVNGEHSLIMLVYNIKRSMNILGVPTLIEKLLNFKHPYMKDSLFLFLSAYFKPKCGYVFSNLSNAA